MPYAHMLSRQVIIKKKHFSERGVPKEPAIYVDAPRRIAMGLEQRHHRRIGQFINEWLAYIKRMMFWAGNGASIVIGRF